MKLDHKIDWELVASIAKTNLLPPLGGTNEELISRALLEAMTRLDKAEKMRDIAYGLLDECKARLDKATELLRASVAHLEDMARDIVLRRSEDVLQARGNLALEMANRLRAFLERKTDDKQS